jgi:predicted lysophospholipase L1 biosynthesis ABC-type transport system permease subunit
VSIDRNTGDLFPLVIALQATYTALGLLIFGGAVLLWRRARHRDAVHMRHVGAG